MGYISEMASKILNSFITETLYTSWWVIYIGHMIGCWSILNFTFLPENEILEHFLQMAGKHSNFLSQKDSICYDKWLVVAEWQGFGHFI